MLEALWSLANFQYSISNFEDAAAVYRQIFEANAKTVGTLGSRLLDPYARCACSLRKAGKEQEALSFEAQYEDRVFVNGIGRRADMLMGRAIELPFPVYPTVGAALKKDATVEVLVVVDPKGSVVFACSSVRGYGFGFVNAAENAAYRAKFRPYTEGGEALSSIGYVTYTFRRR